jgi:hypothetical protein
MQLPACFEPGSPAQRESLGFERQLKNYSNSLAVCAPAYRRYFEIRIGMVEAKQTEQDSRPDARRDAN